jgi:sulfatase modifying factor 1
MPTDAEWNHAAAGGNEQRLYPWSIPPASANIDSSHSTYECDGDGAPGCTIADILPVGSRSPKGDGRWGHADLGGSIYEMVLDDWLPFPAQIPCIDCAALGTQWPRVARGGSWYTTRFFQMTTFRHDMEAISRLEDYGGRCARNP